MRLQVFFCSSRDIHVLRRISFPIVIPCRSFEEMSSYNRILPLTGCALVLTGLTLAASGFSQEPASQAAPPAGQSPATAHPRPPRIVRPGVATPGVSRLLTDIQAEAI